MAKKGYHPGNPKAVCDRCGFTMQLYDLVQEWTGYRVCLECRDLRHPQELIRVRPDIQAVPNGRHEQTADEWVYITPVFPPDTSDL